MSFAAFITLRYYPPEKQGLRHTLFSLVPVEEEELRYYPPEKQGLRQRGGFRDAPDPDRSDTILQKNKD